MVAANDDRKQISKKIKKKNCASECSEMKTDTGMYDEQNVSPSKVNGVVKKLKKANKRKADTIDDAKDPSVGLLKETEQTEQSTFDTGSKKLRLENESGKDNDETDEDETGTTPNITDKEASQITGKSLRAGFNSADSIIVLRKFVTICNDKKKHDLSVQYLNAGGSPLEILKLLDTMDKKSSSNTTTVFSAMEIVVMKILEKYPQYHSSATEACRHLLNSHLSSIHSMLSSQSNAKQRRVVLRLLTAVVSLGGSLPRELLGHLSLHTQVLDTLSSHTQPSDPQCVRTSFVHFILSFLVEGNLSVVRALLEKRGVLSSIFPGLIYDSHQLVNLVLTTIKSYVLENPGISKTIKLHTFSTPVVQNLVSLYNWKGPTNWPGKNRKKNVEESSGHTNLEEKKVVVEVVHEFLSTLLTSNKFGIIFHDRSLGTSGQKNNQLANTILQSLDRPWEYEKPADLVVRILVACPDLIRSQLVYTESYLAPVASKNWVLLMEFMQKVIGSLDPKLCLKPCLPELTISQLFSALTTLTAPLIILKNAIAPSIDHDNALIRQTSIVLLSVMLGQLNNFMNTIRNDSIYRSDAEKIQHLVTDYMLKNIPSLDSILTAWNKALLLDKEHEEDSEAVVTVSQSPCKNSLEAILNLLLMYRDVCPQLLETSSISNSTIDSTKLLTGLNTLENVDEEELGNMKVKALQFLLALDSSAFAPEKELFGQAVPFLISLLDDDQKSKDVISHTRTAMRMLLDTCGVFEDCGYQADIWINSSLGLKSAEERSEIAVWLVEVIRKTTKNANKYIEWITKAEEVVGEQLYSSTTIEDIFADLSERDIEIDRNKTARLLPSVSISPLLPAAFESVINDGRNLLLQYLSRVTIHTLHCQVTPNTLIHLAQDVQELASLSYLSSWIPNSEHAYVKKPFSSKSLITKISKALITDSKIKVNKIFHGSRKVVFKVVDEEFSLEHSMSHEELLALFRLTVFYFTRLIQEEKFTDELIHNVKVLLISLLHIAMDIENTTEGSDNLSEECCKWIFTHPIILQFFSPLYKRKNLVGKYITEMTVQVSLAVIDLFGEQKISDMIVPFKEKFMTKLLSAAKKCRSDERVKDSSSVIQLVEILQLNINYIVEILEVLIELEVDKLLSTDKNHLSMWGLLIPKLLTITATKRNIDSNTQPVSLEKSMIEKICQRTIQLSLCKIKDLDLWIDSLLSHLERFPHNIAVIDKNFFLSLVKDKMSSSAIKLASFLINRNTKFIPVYVKYALHNENVLKAREAIFPILSSIQDHETQPQFFLKLRDLYKNEIFSWFSDPNTIDTCIKKNITAAVRLIDTTIDSKTCDDTCEMILSNGDKLLAVDTSYIQLLKIIFTKAVSVEHAENNRLVDFVQILIHIMVSSLKKESKNTQKHNSLCQILLDILNLVRNKENNSRFHEIRKNHSWPQFTRFSLKLGLKSSKESDAQVQLLKTFVRLCDVVYEDNCDDEYIKTLFEMTTSHSEFINVMLGHSPTKRHLIELLLTLVRKNNSLMTSTHVPLYLGAYNATLSETDQMILQLLQYYESHDVKLTDYRPYLWGSAAASHYSVKTGVDTALWRQPSTSQVLDLFLPEIVNNTVKNYPVNRKLQMSSELHASQSIYDPAFYLPLLCYLLSDNSVVACHKITQSGALALSLSACGSTDGQTRLAAFTVISRFYYHLEATNSKEKLLWMHFIDIFRKGISSAEPELKNVQISCLVTTFMARTSLVATQPLNPLYSSLQKFLVAKPSLDLATIPEFLQLFHSSEIDHKLHRFWILEVVRDGLKTAIDGDLAFRCVLFKMLLDFYNCALADRQTQNLILQVINSAVKIPNTAVLLVTGYGLLPWLHEIIYSSDVNDTEFVTIFTEVTLNLYDSLVKSNEKNEDVYFMFLQTMMNFKKILSRSTDIESYKNYVSTMEKIVSFKPNDFCKILSFKFMTALVELSKTILGEIKECQDILQHGSKFANKTLSLYCPDSYSTSDSNVITLAKTSLIKLLFTWYSVKEI
ncbi:nucleolar pre-ribosomal-associated protein 1 [Neodiprion lecontei]|uniref:Nucleolar pre-ribosomal-associated protein 1 n=1 Tax=Neodiprion lecontei TaxID=441921 RepID=A0A6J0BJE0_NEOLC|nr:nucleolar pre-ribosomal-associated protein 1 [Neodiprion lecontei]